MRELYKAGKVDGEAIREALEILGLAQTKAAEQLGVSHSTLYRWMEGKAEPMRVFLPALEALYDKAQRAEAQSG